MFLNLRSNFLSSSIAIAFSKSLRPERDEPIKVRPFSRISRVFMLT